jgi:hypothetical protein
VKVIVEEFGEPQGCLTVSGLAKGGTFTTKLDLKN